ncbi:MAG: hypothetical protein WDZ94_00570 [Patescibacteria group bacterium]
MSAHTRQVTNTTTSQQRKPARSRLRPHSEPRQRQSNNYQSYISSFFSSFIAPRKKYLPTLLLSLLCYLIVFYILTQVHPASIAHLPLPYSYAPLQIALAAGNFLLFSFLLLQRRQAIIVSSWIAVLLFLKLQLFVVHWLVIAISGLCMIALELILSKIEHTK